MFEPEEEEILEKVYNSDEDDYIIETKAKTENNIYSKIKYECKKVMKNLGIK